MDPREARVRAVIEAARAIVREPDLVPALVASTGLSREGVELALARHLELAPTDAELVQLLARTRETPAVTVILSANVFVGALRAIALACAASSRVRVRPSRRDPLFATRLCAALPDVDLAPALVVEDVGEGELHVYGRDETIADVRTRARVPVRGHGAGMGIAWVTTPEEAARLADDVVAFDQRGCLSPRVVFVQGDARACVQALHEALGSSPVPRGALLADERAEAERWRATMTYAGEVYAGPEHAVAVGPLVVPPPGRHVQLVPVASHEEAAALLAPLRRFVTTFGTDDDDRLAPPCARIAHLGEMQRPPLDGPVDLRPDGARLPEHAVTQASTGA